MASRIGHTSVAAPPARCWTVVCVVALLSSGCTWYSITPKERVGPPPEAAPRALNVLVLGESRDAVLDCSRKECNHWYRLDVPLGGTLKVEVAVEPHDDTRAMMRLLVRQIGRNPVAQAMRGKSARAEEITELPTTLTVRPMVHEGLWMVLVQAGGARLPYTVTARLSPDAT